MPRGHTHQERNSATLSKPFYKTRQAHHFVNHAKIARFIEHASTLSTRTGLAHEHTKHAKQAKYVSTQGRHLAYSFLTVAEVVSKVLFCFIKCWDQKKLRQELTSRHCVMPMPEPKLGCLYSVLVPYLYKERITQNHASFSQSVNVLKAHSQV